MISSRPKPTSPNDWPIVRMYGSDFRPCLHDMYEVITELNLWNAILKEPSGGSGFMFSTENYVSAIVRHPKVLQSGHSGATAACALRDMQEIARYGWDEYCLKRSATVEESNNNFSCRIF